MHESRRNLKVIEFARVILTGLEKGSPALTSGYYLSTADSEPHLTKQIKERLRLQIKMFLDFQKTPKKLMNTGK